MELKEKIEKAIYALKENDRESEFIYMSEQDYFGLYIGASVHPPHYLYGVEVKLSKYLSSGDVIVSEKLLDDEVLRQMKNEAIANDPNFVFPHDLDQVQKK